jgi:signal transduction histidine kinase
MRGTTSAVVRLRASDEAVTFEVEDRGAGFDPSTTSYGTGLQGMADRLSALGGELHVTSSPGAGTTVTGTLPVGTAHRRGRPHRPAAGYVAGKMIAL